jgi:hypothetical protein
VRPGDEATSIRARYGHMIIPVAHVAQPAGSSVIDVADMDALVRIAEHYDRSILHETAGGAEAFWVTDESGQFRYTVGSPASFADESPAAPQPAVRAESQQPPYTVSAPAFLVQQPPVEPSTIEFPAVYANELELAGQFAAFEAATPEPIVPAPEPIVPEPAPTDDWARANTASHERWIARDLADALTNDNLSWPSTEETADIGHARARAFARVAGLN